MKNNSAIRTYKYYCILAIFTLPCTVKGPDYQTPWSSLTLNSSNSFASAGYNCGYFVVHKNHKIPELRGVTGQPIPIWKKEHMGSCLSCLDYKAEEIPG